MNDLRVVIDSPSAAQPAEDAQTASLFVVEPDLAIVSPTQATPRLAGPGDVVTVRFQTNVGGPYRIAFRQDGVWGNEVQGNVAAGGAIVTESASIAVTVFCGRPSLVCQDE